DFFLASSGLRCFGQVFNVFRIE
ncbi:hypothetical protein CGH79_18630, partial [Vibrio parahaemolyticus]